MGFNSIKLKPKFLRFFIGGIFVTCIYISIAFLIQQYFFSNLSIANALAFIVANVSSYLIHTVWSFSEVIKKKNLLRFYIVTLGAFILAILIPLIGQYSQMNYLVINICTAIIISIFTFLSHLFWTYK